MEREPVDEQGSTSSAFASIEDAVAAIARGEIVVVVDDEDPRSGNVVVLKEYVVCRVYRRQ